MFPRFKNAIIFSKPGPIKGRLNLSKFITITVDLYLGIIESNTSIKSLSSLLTFFSFW